MTPPPEFIKNFEPSAETATLRWLATPSCMPILANHRKAAARSTRTRSISSAGNRSLSNFGALITVMADLHLAQSSLRPLPFWVNPDWRLDWGQRRFSLIRSAALSAIMMVGAFVFPLTIEGMIEASTTRSPLKPWTRNWSSTTAALSVAIPILQVPTG